MSNYRLQEVKTAADARKFLDMAAGIYQDDSNWVQPLDNDIESVFDPARNPLFQGGEAIRWLLLDEKDNAVGRIAAFYNRDQAATELQPTGGCGFFECIDDQQAANMLFDAAREWLCGKGMEAMDGSINFGDRLMWWGVLVEGFTLPLYGMNYNPPYYGKLFEAYGFQNYFNQHTYFRDTHKLGQLPEALYAKAERLFANPDYRFDNPDLKDMKQVARDFMSVYNSGWAEFTGVQPMNFDHAFKLVSAMKPIIDPKAVIFAYYKGQAVGFFIMVPDLNPIIRDFKGKLGLIQKLKLMWHLKITKKSRRLFGVVFGVATEFQARGIEAGMIRRFEIEQETTDLPYDSLELAWIGDFNPLMMRMAEKYVIATQCKRHITYRYLFDRTKEFTRAPKLRAKRPTNTSQSQESASAN